MKISFDLDDTIIPGNKTFPIEKQSFTQKLLKLEHVRQGTIELFKELKKRNHKVGVYTTSFRSKTRIWLLFSLHGFSPDFIINQKANLQKLGKGATKYSKYPVAFNIDIHIDDSKGVELEGREYGFETIIIDEHHPDWANHILEEIEFFQSA